MLLFQHSHPAVYQTYKAARMIVDLHKAIKKAEVEDWFSVIADIWAASLWGGAFVLSDGSEIMFLKNS